VGKELYVFWPGGHTEAASPSMLSQLKTLRGCGADLHAKSRSGFTILQIIWFSDVMGVKSKLSKWIQTLEDIGDDVREYTRKESIICQNLRCNIRLGLKAELRFDEDVVPPIWIVFQGPEEEAEGVYRKKIEQCAIWPKWHEWIRKEQGRIYVPLNYVTPEYTTSIPDRQIPGSSPISTYRFPRPSKLFKDFSLARLPPQKPLRYLILATRYRYEFTFYVFLLTSFLGYGYLQRLWISVLFMACLHALREYLRRRNPSWN